MRFLYRRVCKKWKALIDAKKFIPEFLRSSNAIVTKEFPYRTLYNTTEVVGCVRLSAVEEELLCVQEKLYLCRLNVKTGTLTAIAKLPFYSACDAATELVRFRQETDNTIRLYHLSNPSRILNFRTGQYIETEERNVFYNETYSVSLMEPAGCSYLIRNRVSQKELRIAVEETELLFCTIWRDRLAFIHQRRGSDPARIFRVFSLSTQQRAEGDLLPADAIFKRTLASTTHYSYAFGTAYVLLSRGGTVSCYSFLSNSLRQLPDCHGYCLRERTMDYSTRLTPVSHESLLLCPNSHRRTSEIHVIDLSTGQHVRKFRLTGDDLLPRFWVQARPLSFTYDQVIIYGDGIMVFDIVIVKFL